MMMMMMMIDNAVLGSDIRRTRHWPNGHTSRRFRLAVERINVYYNEATGKLRPAVLLNCHSRKPHCGCGFLPDLGTCRLQTFQLNFRAIREGKKRSKKESKRNERRKGANESSGGPSIFREWGQAGNSPSLHPYPFRILLFRSPFPFSSLPYSFPASSSPSKWVPKPS